MAPFIYHLFEHAYRIFRFNFLLDWLFFLGLIVVCALLLGSPPDSLSSGLSQRGASYGRMRLRSRLSLTDGISVIALLLFVAFYIVLIFYKEDFAAYDDDQLTDFSLRGQSFPPPIWPSVGRFLPLGLLEFNLLRLITKSPAGYHSFSVAQLIILLLALVVVLGEYKFVYRVPILIAATLAPSFVLSFTSLVIPDRNVLFWLAIMLLCLCGYSKTKAPIYFIGCLVATHFALYYKETVVVFVVAYAGAQLLLQSYRRRRTGYRSWQELARENSLQVGMLAVSGIYVVLFLVMLPHPSFSYIIAKRAALSFLILGYLQLDWLVFILIPVLVLRLGWFVFCEGQLDPMWDSLAIGALAYFFCLIALRLYMPYYTASVDLIALLYLARVSLSWLLNPTKVRVSVVTTVFVCILLHNTAYSSFAIIENKNFIAIKSQFAGFLRTYGTRVSSSTVELFFPYADGYRLMELSAYLRYKGFRLAGQKVTGSEAGPGLVVEGRNAFANSRCVGYRDYACIHADSARDGALIIVLPDDMASMADVEEIGKDSVLLFSTQTLDVRSRPGSWLKLLHATSYLSDAAFCAGSSCGELPEHWLRLHVFAKIHASTSSESDPSSVVRFNISAKELNTP
jgi:hypothetical protein